MFVLKCEKSAAARKRATVFCLLSRNFLDDRANTGWANKNCGENIFIFCQMSFCFSLFFCCVQFKQITKFESHNHAVNPLLLFRLDFFCLFTACQFGQFIFYHCPLSIYFKLMRACKKNVFKKIGNVYQTVASVVEVCNTVIFKSDFFIFIFYDHFCKTKNQVDI